MIASYNSIREGIAANIQARVEGLQVSAYLLANPTPPSCYVMPGTTEYDKAMRRGLDEVFMVVTAFVTLTSDIGSQKLLGAYQEPTGPLSIKEAIESDPSLGGVVNGLHVTDMGPQRLATLETVTAGPSRPAMLAVDWNVRVLASN